MKCPHCNQEHEGEAKFCPMTGKIMPEVNTMKNCINSECRKYMKYDLPPDALFCPECGQPVEVGKSNSFYGVVLLSSGSSKVQVVKVLSESLGFGLYEAKKIVDDAPALIKSGLAKHEAEQLKNDLDLLGATADIAEEGNADALIDYYLSHGGNMVKEMEDGERRIAEENDNFNHNLFLGIGALVLSGVLWAILIYIQPFLGIPTGIAHGLPIVSGLALYRSYSR